MDAITAPGAPYALLRRRFGRIGALDEAASVLSWDASAMMPHGGADARGEQLATVRALAHELLIADETEDLIGRAERREGSDHHGNDDGGDDADLARNLALMRRRLARARAVPSDLVAARARAETACELRWRTARQEDDFAGVRGPFEALLALVRDSAAGIAAATGLDPLDALIDEHQPGLDTVAIEALFAPYERFLRDALPSIEARQARFPAPRLLPAPVGEGVQEELCRMLAGAAGLDWTHARLDRSLHPFCGGTPDDVRITTRYDIADPGRAIMGVLHETGHALYERGLPARFRRQPIGENAGMAVHESQSLIVEMQACRSDAYLRWLGPVLADRFGGDADAYALDNLARLWRRVGRTLIRVDADEATYPAHVLLRFRLERALLDGSLAARDLPGAWSDALAGLLGVRPADDRDGCLQDIHWFTGLYGYFPAYTVGAMAAAQLMAACRRAEPDLDASFARGDLAPLTTWLRREVHAHGAREELGALIERVTGAPLGAGCFIAHLHRRYGDG